MSITDEEQLNNSTLNEFEKDQIAPSDAVKIQNFGVNLFKDADEKLPSCDVVRSQESSNIFESTTTSSAVANKVSFNSSNSPEEHQVDSESLVCVYCIIPEDQSEATDYMFFLLSQFKLGYFTKAECERGARKNLVLKTCGYPGLRCKHCGGLDTGSYFPSTCKNLQSAPANMHKHLLVCPKCPEECRQSVLLSKSQQKAQAALLPTGSQHAFFDRIWTRLHNLKWPTEGPQNNACLVDEICQKIWIRLTEKKNLDLLKKKEKSSKKSAFLFIDDKTVIKEENNNLIKSEICQMAKNSNKQIGSHLKKKKNIRKRPGKNLEEKSPKANTRHNKSARDNTEDVSAEIDFPQPFTRDAGYEVARLFEERVLDLNVGLNIRITDASLESPERNKEGILPMPRKTEENLSEFSHDWESNLSDYSENFSQGCFPTSYFNFNEQVLTPFSRKVSLLGGARFTATPVSFGKFCRADVLAMTPFEVNTPLHASKELLTFEEFGSNDRNTLLHLLAE